MCLRTSVIFLLEYVSYLYPIFFNQYGFDNAFRVSLCITQTTMLYHVILLFHVETKMRVDSHQFNVSTLEGLLYLELLLSERSICFLKV